MTIEEMRARNKIEEEQRAIHFLDNLDVLDNQIDSLIMPSVGIKRKDENGYVYYCIQKHEDGLKYYLNLFESVYPYKIYDDDKYSGYNAYNKDQIPQKYMPQFEELEKYFE